jgi:hypothetical protein
MLRCRGDPTARSARIDNTVAASSQARRRVPGTFIVLDTHAARILAGTTGQENSQALPISTKRIGPWRSARLPLPQEGRTDPN